MTWPEKAEPKIRAILVRKTGMSVSARIYWESAVSPTEISCDDVYAAQVAAGYHPAGYDLFGFSCQKVDGGYKATWSCAASCD